MREDPVEEEAEVEVPAEVVGEEEEEEEERGAWEADTVLTAHGSQRRRKSKGKIMPIQFHMKDFMRSLIPDC